MLVYFSEVLANVHLRRQFTGLTFTLILDADIVSPVFRRSVKRWGRRRSECWSVQSDAGLRCRIECQKTGPTMSASDISRHWPTLSLLS